MPPYLDGRDAHHIRSFPPFRIDLKNERLWRGDEELKVRRKPFAILKYLVVNALTLVTPDQLSSAVWEKTSIHGSLLRTHIGELRRLLGEGVIETVAGRGYRFLLSPAAEQPALTNHTRLVEARPGAVHLIDRIREMNVLQSAFQSALDGKRQIVFVTGDPGIGKTSLVDAFLERFANPSGALVAVGACVEQFGTGESYLPVLAALGAASRGPDGEGLVELLARHAPTWLTQMPGLVPDQKLPELHLRASGATQARMLRELAESFDIVAAERPVVLVLEDMQWSDRSTIDLVSVLGARREAARVLVIATCRPAEIVKGDGLPTIMAELTAHKQAVTLQVNTWSPDAVAEYLAQRFGQHLFPAQLVSTIHDMTGGNPLFSIALIDDLEARHMVRPRQEDSRWELAAGIAEVAERRPETTRQLIELQIDRLKPSEQRLIEAAALAGAQFAAGTVAHALEGPPDEVDAACEALVNERRLLRFVSRDAWPDGTVQSLYAFAHALYRDAALVRLPSATKRVWHRRIAERLEAAHGDSSETVAAELAIHFDEAQEIDKAIRHYCVAGERAMRRFGRADALAHFSRARVLVARLPPSQEADRIELTVLTYLGPAVIALHGFRDPMLAQTFTRTAELARALGDDRDLLAALLGLQRCHFLRGELRSIEGYEGEIAEIVSRLADPVLAAEATGLAASARLFRGQLAAARGPLAEASSVLDAAHTGTERAVNAPVVGNSRGHLAVLAWLEGAPDEAIVHATKMLARARALGDPLHLATALTISALAHMWRRNPEETFETAQQALRVARDAGSLVWQGRALSLYHWAGTILEPGAAMAHFTALSTGLSGLLSAGPYGRTAFTPCLVEVFARAGHLSMAFEELDDALAYVERSDERAWSSELHRLRGELLMDSDPETAARAMTTALEIARQQGARSFELRAALSLTKLAREPERHRAAIEDLRRVFTSFTEGFETGDLVEAKAVLARYTPG